MPEHLRALIAILFLAALVFGFAQGPARDLKVTKDYTYHRNLWVSLTLLAFLAHDYWIYVTLSGIAAIVFSSRVSSPLALFFFVLVIIPRFSKEISGFGIVNFLIAVDHVRLMAVSILLPTLLLLRRQRDTLSFGSNLVDKILIGYLFVVFFLGFRETSVTNGLRGGAYLFIDIFLPYYVASRSLADLKSFYAAAFGFFVAGLLQAAIGFFEYVRHWELYEAVRSVLGIDWDFSRYLMRGDELRARAAAGQPIALGYFIVVAVGFFLFLSEKLRGNLRKSLSGMALVVGLWSTLSRGPWVGAVVLLAAFVGTGRFALLRVLVFSVVGILVLAVANNLPGWSKFLDLLPFIGTVDQGNVDYRYRLVDNALAVVWRHPWFGSADFLNNPEMEQMRQSRGLIDVVNTYFGVALKTGLVGLSLFVGFFVMVLFRVYAAIRSLPDRDGEVFRLGRALFAILLAILVIIFTVSSISIIPVVYWSVAGMGVAYAQMVGSLKR